MICNELKQDGDNNQIGGGVEVGGLCLLTRRCAPLPPSAFFIVIFTPTLAER